MKLVNSFDISKENILPPLEDSSEIITFHERDVIVQYVFQ